MTETMFIPFFYVLPILFILGCIGSLFIVHMQKTDGIEFYSPWIGASVLVNIAVLMNFSKIPIGKNIFDIPYFNGITFIASILLFIAVLCWIFLKKIDFGFRKKHLWLYSFFIICVIIFTAAFFNKLGSSYFSERAISLQSLSLAENMMVNKQIEPNQFEVGVSLLISFFAKIFDISPLMISRMIHGLFAVSGTFLLAIFISKITKPTGKNILLIVSFTIFVILFFLFPINNISISTIFIIGMIALIGNLTHDYLKILESSQQSFFQVEEIVLSLSFLFLASLNGPAFKIGIAFFLILIGFRLLSQKKQLSYGWLRVILIMCLLNPLLIGLVLRY